MTATRTSPPASPPEEAKGFVKRGPRFEEYVSRASTWRWSPGETPTRLLLALPAGARDLTARELRVLMVYVSHLNWDALEQENDACVWPSTQLVYDLADIPEATGRRIRASLEAKGYLIRWFNRANRPKGDEAVDLAVLMSRLGELEGAMDAVYEAHKERRAAQGASIDLERRGEGERGRSGMGARVITGEPLEQTQRNDSSSVRGSAPAAPASRGEAPGAPRAPGRGSAAPAARSRSKAPAARGASGRAVGSIGARALEEQLRAGLAGARAPRGGARVSVSGPFPASVRAEMALQELQLAVQVSPRIARLVPPEVLENAARASPADAENWARAAGDLLPDPKRNNADTFRWAWRAHGIRALAMLALAIEDKVVEKPANWFGGMAKSDPERLDLRPNFARMLRERGEMPRVVTTARRAADPPPAAAARPALERPGLGLAKWHEVLAVLRPLVAYADWADVIQKLGFGGVLGHLLLLEAPSTAIRERAYRRKGEILEAAERAGVPVKDVKITVRAGAWP